MVIRTLDHVRHCYTYDDGLVIAGLLRSALCDRETAFLSFAGVDDVPSSFVNGAFVSLLDEFSARDIKTYIRIVDSTRQINSMVRARVEAGEPDLAMVA